MQKRILVTGASVGIGRQTAVAFARQGARLALNYRQATEDAEETLRLVRAAGGSGLLLQGDMGDADEAAWVVNKAAAGLGGLDVLVNNAGVTRFIPFGDLEAVTHETWETLMRTNVQSVFFASRAVAKIMEGQEGGGCIINLASAAGMYPRGSSIPYCVSKAAVIHLTSCLAKELAPKIRVNVVSPGVIQNTRWNESNPNFNLEAYRAAAGGIAMKRLGEPEDIAQAICYLASDAAGFVTGVNLPVEGGAHLL